MELLYLSKAIPRGTSRKVFEILGHRLHVVHTPHRWYASEEKEHGVNQLRVIGGIYDCCLHEGMQFYNGQLFENKYNGTDIIYTNMAATLEPSLSSSFVASNKSLEIPMHPLPMVEIAEVTKIVENAHRYLQIAFAEELYLYCQENKMSFLEI